METKQRKARKTVPKSSPEWKVTVNPSLGKGPLPPVIQAKLDRANETLARVGMPNAEQLQSGLEKTVIDPTLEEKLGNRVLFAEKLARANEDIKKYGLPDGREKR